MTSTMDNIKLDIKNPAIAKQFSEIIGTVKGCRIIKSDDTLKSDLQIFEINGNPEEFNLTDESNKCYLSRGILCLGPITRDGCEHRCIKFGVPCEGCMGPVSKDITSNVINFLSLVSKSFSIASSLWVSNT